MDFSLVARSLANLPLFFGFFAACLVMVAAFLAVYMALTPYHEWRLIREGNVAAAASLGGALVGFAIPLANIVAQTHVILDAVVWAAVALFVQLFVWWVVDKSMPGMRERLERGEVASGVFLAATSIAAGLINSGCMTY
jgi:putative membrane protein